MIHIGKYNELEVIKEVEFGLYLSDRERSSEILLPLKYVPAETRPGHFLNVFVYHDSENRVICTTLHPKAVTGEFAWMKVISVAPFGAFLDWGIAKDLLVPLKEQPVPMQEGSWYLVYVYPDVETGRVVASARWTKFTENTDLEVAEGDMVNLLIADRTDLGYNAIINNRHVGLIYRNEIFEPISTGEKRRGFIKKIREENKIDISLQAIGYEHIEEARLKLLQLLEKGNGTLPLGDKSSPQEIYDQVKMSKKAFKKAIGGLFKEKLIVLADNQISLLRK